MIISQKVEIRTKLMNFPKQKLAVIAFFILLIGVVALAIFSFQKNMQNTHSENKLSSFIENIFSPSKPYSTKKIKELLLENTENSAYCPYNGGLARSAGGRIYLYDSTGKELWSENIINSSPFLKVDGNWLLCGDFDGRWIYAINGNEIKWSKELPASSVIGDINADGYVSVVSKSTGYKSEVTIFNPQGKKYLSRMVAEDYISSTKVISGKSQFVLSRINTDGPYIKSSFEYNSLDKEDPLGSLNLGGTTILNIDTLGGGLLSLLGEKTSVMLDYDYKKLWQHDYEQILAHDKIGSNEMVLTVRGNLNGKTDNQINTIIVGRSGEEYSIYKSNNDVEGISANNGVVAINEGNQIIFVSTSGKIISKYISGQSVQKAFVLNGSNGALINGEKIEFINFKG